MNTFIILSRETVEPREIGAAEDTDAVLSNELGGGGAGGRVLAWILHGYYCWLISVGIIWISQLLGVWLLGPLGWEGGSEWDSSSCYGRWGCENLQFLMRVLLGRWEALVLICRPAPAISTR